MYPLEVRKVMAALGGARTVGRKPETLAELAEMVARGLPSAVVPKLAANAAPDDPAARRRWLLSSHRPPASSAGSVSLRKPVSERSAWHGLWPWRRRPLATPPKREPG